MRDNPFDWFDHVRCIFLNPDEAAWTALRKRFASWGIGERMQATPADPRWVEPRLRAALSHRRALEQAFAAGAEHLLVVEPGALPLRDAADPLAGLIREIGNRDWNLFYLGAATWGERVERLPGCRHLARARQLTGTHAIAYSRAAVQRLLDEMPGDAPRMGDWIAAQESYDHFLATLPDRWLARPALASLPQLLPYEDPALRASYVSEGTVVASGAFDAVVTRPRPGPGAPDLPEFGRSDSPPAAQPPPAGSPIPATASGLPRIFVQIPSYRDRECQWTVKDLFDKARHPQRVFVGICWQFDPETDQDCFRAASPRPENTRRVDFRAAEARGLGWARLQAQGLWRGEEYTLQIDSHMRFVQDWDERMLEELAACPSRWPVLTLYPASYWPPDERQESDDARRAVMAMKDFTSSGILRFTVRWAPAAAPVETPKPTAGLAGGFVFGPSRIIRDVPSDPAIYFEGEEPSLAVRLWTHGFDLFSPRSTLIYHYYRRSDSRRPWDDVSSAAPNARSLAHLRRLFEPRPGDAEALGRFGLGAARTLEQYEAFAGVDFRGRTIASCAFHYPFVYADETAEALVSLVPPVPAADAQLFLPGGDGVLFSGRRRLFHRVTPAAAWCWCALEAGEPPAAVIAGLARRSGLDPAAARRHFLSRVCHWQSVGLLADSTRLVPEEMRPFGEEPSPPEVAWPAVPPPGVRPVEAVYRLLDGDIRVICFGADYAAQVASLLGPLRVTPAAAGAPAQVIRIFGVAGFHYLVRNDRYPARLVADPAALPWALLGCLEQIAEAEPASLLHVQGGLVDDGPDGALLVLGEGARLAAMHAADPAAPWRAGSRVQIHRGSGRARTIPLPAAVPRGALEAPGRTLPPTTGPQPVIGHGASACRLLYPPALPTAPRRVTRLVALTLTGDYPAEPARLVPLPAVEGLEALIRVSAARPPLATVEDAASLIGWLEERPCFELKAPNLEQALVLLAGAHPPPRGDREFLEAP